MGAKLEELGVPPTAVLQKAGLPRGLFDLPKIYVSTDQLFAFYEAVAALSNDPAIGLRLGDEWRIERYDPIAIASLYAHTFRDALERAARYKRLTCPEDIVLAEQGDRCAVRFEWLLAADRAEPRVLVDLCLAWLLTIGRRGTGRAVAPVRVDLRRSESDPARYANHFGCEVRSGAAHNAMLFRRADLERPSVTHNADLLALIAPQLEAELAFQQAQSSTRDLVKTTLKRVLAGRRPELGDVARELGQSPRTLQRRLAEAGASFKDLLEEARRELARHYLRNSTLEFAETAYLLGYEDTNSFFRAFARWEGMPPGRWRASTEEGGRPIGGNRPGGINAG